VNAVALILAAGSGDRLGAGVPKALVALRGRPMVLHVLETVAASEVVQSVILVVPKVDRARFEAVLSERPQAVPIEAVVPGGWTRQESVRLGLEALGGHPDVVLCHDAARPLASAELFRRVIDGLAGVAGCVPIVPSPDTVKLVEDGRVIRTLPRSQIGLAQTPQAFELTALREAHARAAREGQEGTDDGMLVEAAGYVVGAVEGEAGNFKITTLEDLRRAEQVLAARAEGALR
jgi:2-C-methyl-D-erythritol 4-phosphate cytidylyltransferase